MKRVGEFVKCRIKMGKRRRRGRKVSSTVDRIRVENVRTDWLYGRVGQMAGRGGPA